MTHALIAQNARVAVVGAGAAGLAMARVLKEAGYYATVFERGDDVGGQWNCGSSTSVMYNNLRCNLPKECMQFRDVPFENHLSSSYLSHQQVQAYLVKFSRRFELRSLIRFGALVEHITPCDSGWRIFVTEEDGTHKEFEFDSVCVASGHYARANPYIPPGAPAFCTKGRSVSHSRIYRTPTPYVGRRVVIVGASSSGTDIALELERSGAAAVYLSHSSGACRPPFGGSIPQVACIESLFGDGSIRLQDGTKIEDIDDVLLCTGYLYDLSFLDPTSGVCVELDGRVINGLVSHCVGLEMPTLSLIGVPVNVLPFPMFEDQARFAVAVLSGVVSREELRKLHSTEHDEYEVLGQNRKYWHKLMDRQWECRRVQASLARFPSPAMNIIEIYNDSRAARRRSIRTYRERVYKIHGKEWRVYYNGEDVTGKFELNTCPLEIPMHP